MAERELGSAQVNPFKEPLAVLQMAYARASEEPGEEDPDESPGGSEPPPPPPPPLARRPGGPPLGATGKPPIAAGPATSSGAVW